MLLVINYPQFSPRIQLNKQLLCKVLLMLLHKPCGTIKMLNSNLPRKWKNSKEGGGRREEGRGGGRKEDEEAGGRREEGRGKSEEG